jgi:hypothetical protein
LWRAASDLSQAIPPALERLTDAKERKQLDLTIQKMASKLKSQGKIV